MEGIEILFIGLTYDEAYELFSRCLKSTDEDSEASRSALRKLGILLDERASSNRKAA